MDLRSQFVKRIEVMDQPGDNHFAEALANALGPTSKEPTARAQIVSIVTMLEPEAASTGFSSSNSTGPTTLLLLQMMSQNSMQMQQSAVGGLGTQNSSSAFGTLPQFGNIPPVSSNPGTTATGGGTQDATTPTYNSKTLATLLKNSILNTEQVSTIFTSQGIDVNDVCSAAFDQPTPPPAPTALPEALFVLPVAPLGAHLLSLSFRAWALLMMMMMMNRPLLNRPH
jgi:hypothetical protein